GGRRMIKSLALVIGKKEQLVLYDRSTDSTTEHVPAELWLRHDVGRIKTVFPLIGIQLVVAEKLENVTVQAISAGLDGGADDTTLEIAEFCRRVLGDHVEFLNGVNTRGKTHQIV